MKIKYILAFIFVLVVGLVGGFFIGFGVTNKDLGVDWKAVAPIISAFIASTIAATIAIHISNKWSKQKGGEVIADEAKQVIKDILELVKLINYLEIDTNGGKNLDVEFEKYVNGYELIVINTAFIENCLDDNDLKVNFKKFAASSLKVKRTIKKDKKRPGDKELTDAVEEFSKEALNLVNTLNPYSIFKKDCKFKLKEALSW